MASEQAQVPAPVPRAARLAVAVYFFLTGVTFASVCLSVMLPILALAPSLPVLVASLVLFGASFGSVNVAMNTQGVAVERRYGHSIFSSFHACYSIGGLTGSLVGGLVAARDIAPLPHFFGIAFLAIVLALSL